MPGKSGIYLGVSELSDSESSTSSKCSVRSLSPQPHYTPKRENPTRKVVDSLLDKFLFEKLKCTRNSEIKRILESAIYDHLDNTEHIYRWLFDNENTLQYKSLLGFFLLMGIGCESNLNKAFQKFIAAAKKDYLIGHEMVGDCYLNGWGTPKNDELAFQWYKKCVDNNEGSFYGYFALGYCYESGKGVVKDEVEAFRCYDRCAKLGNVMAMRTLADRYTNGVGVARNSEKANFWYQKALEKEMMESTAFLDNV
ncbi:9371_t:CDS:1 [Acaulospora colombiana]|uniref:9371_t:CDS:1 n=1 Tax=Acaulospora colombiana TaxID=27376 RepID=A0ACA9LF78_9GLOM|nr:9371_t:CDS:1 [Acaulospora colombiana]